MNATNYVLQNPTLLVNFFVGQIPAVAVFFGITYFVLSKVTRIKTRSVVGVAYFFAPSLLLALFAWGLRAKDYSDGIQLLVPAILSVLSCCALYYQEWCYQHQKPLLAAMTSRPQCDVKIEKQLNLMADDAQAAASRTVGKSNNGRGLLWPSLGLSLAFAAIPVIVYWIVVSWPGISSAWNKPNYIVEDAGEYGYKESGNRAADQSVRIFRYAGVHKGKHQVYEQDSTGNIERAYECATPCKAIKKLSYLRVRSYASPKSSYRNPFEAGGFYGASFIAADVDSAEARVMEDAINGYLKVQPLNSAAMRLYRVSIETGMDGVPISPVFSEDGIAFQYMAEAPTAQPGALPVAKQPITEESLDRSKSPANEEFPKRKAESKKSNDAQPTSSSTEAAVKPVEQSIAVEENEEAKLTAAHPDWRALILTSEFFYWRDNVISDGKALMASENSEYIARRMSQFKRWKLEQHR